MKMNEDYVQKCFPYSCVYCLRKYPETRLNIEGLMHHNCAHMCLDAKDCKKHRKKLKKL